MVKNVLVLDLLEEQKKNLYFNIDPHFNKEGHLLAAELIYNHLIASNILE